MAQLFSPKPQQIEPPPPSPIVDEGFVARQTQDLARKRKGVAANIIAGDKRESAPGDGYVKSKALGGY